MTIVDQSLHLLHYCKYLKASTARWSMLDLMNRFDISLINECVRTKLIDSEGLITFKGLWVLHCKIYKKE